MPLSTVQLRLDSSLAKAEKVSLLGTPNVSSAAKLVTGAMCVFRRDLCRSPYSTHLLDPFIEQDCSRLPHGLIHKEPPAFSRHHADFGSWPFDYNSKDHHSRFLRAAEELKHASVAAAANAYEEPPAFQAGRMGKEKSLRLARESNKKRQLDTEDDDDADDWFNNGHKRAGTSTSSTKRVRADPHANGDSNRRSHKNKNGDDPGSSKAVDEVAAWFKRSDAHSSKNGTPGGKKGKDRAHDQDRGRYETRDEREEREYLEHQSQRGGRYEEDEDHGVRSRSHGGGRRDYDHDASRPEHDSKRSNRSTRANRSPDHRGARDRKDLRQTHPPPPAASLSQDPPNLAISIRGASSGGKSALLKQRQKPRPRDGDEPILSGKSSGSGRRYRGGEGSGSSSKFGPKWRGGYAND